MSQSQISNQTKLNQTPAVFRGVCRELQFALIRLALAFDNILDIQEFEDVSLKMVSLKLMKRTLEDAKDNINSILEKLNEIEKVMMNE
jgi:CII-binding regulator of phage lambda lysogenization HflD